MKKIDPSTNHTTTIGIFVLRILSKLKLIDFTDYHNKLLVSNIVMDISKIKKELNFSSDKVYIGHSLWEW